MPATQRYVFDLKNVHPKQDELFQGFQGSPWFIEWIIECVLGGEKNKNVI